jgi:hypothetical protein
MRKSLIPGLSCVMLAILLVLGCQKTRDNELIYNEKGELKRPGGHREECRLSSFAWDNNSSEFFHYNNKGLLDEWKVEGNGGAPFTSKFTMEYDQKGRLTKAKTYDGDVAIDECIFEYKHGRIVTENWTDPATGDLIAQTNLTYNYKGWIIKKDDPINQFYATFKYDRWGNNIQNEVVGYDGTIYVRIINEFKKPVRNAYNAVAGLPYPFFWTNAIISPRQETSIDVFIPDENGVLFPLFDRSSEKNILIANKYKLPAFQNHYDFVSERWDTQVWNYDNCDGKCDIPSYGNNSSNGHRGTVINKYAKFSRAIPRMSIRQLKKELEALRRR